MLQWGLYGYFPSNQPIHPLVKGTVKLLFFCPIGLTAVNSVQHKDVTQVMFVGLKGTQKVGYFPTPSPFLE
jgi:hypothetical protein